MTAEVANEASERELMGRAQALAERARRRTAPNPWVGCVIVAAGRVVGEGATQPPGGAHAEVEALRAAGTRARGATVYVTLEPCAHHGRTPPCVDALVEAGVARVVVALEDPDDQVAGRGIATLRERGVVVDVGLGADRARASLAPYLLHRSQRRSFCLVKTAMSLDGRIAAAGGRAEWITSAEARADAHELRADSQAVVVGAGTALADQPALTARDVATPVEHQPLRVLLDARGRVPATGPLFDADLAPTLVITTAAALDTAVDAWLAAGAKVATVPAAGDGRGVDLLAALEHLAGLGVIQAMVEGGAQVAGALLDARLVDRLVTYVAPTLLGPAALPAFACASAVSVGSAPQWTLTDVTRLGRDLRVTYEPADAPNDGEDG